MVRPNRPSLCERSTPIRTSSPPSFPRILCSMQGCPTTRTGSHGQTGDTEPVSYRWNVWKTTALHCSLGCAAGRKGPRTQHQPLLNGSSAAVQAKHAHTKAQNALSKTATGGWRSEQTTVRGSKCTVLQINGQKLAQPYEEGQGFSWGPQAQRDSPDGSLQSILPPRGSRA